MSTLAPPAISVRGVEKSYRDLAVLRGSRIEAGAPERI